MAKFFGGDMEAALSGPGTEGSPDFLYGVLSSYFSFFTLFWIFPYALLTARAPG